MHRAPNPHTWQDRVVRLLPYVAGGAVAAILLIVAASIRFAGDVAPSDVAGTAITPAPASVPATQADAVPESATLPPTTVSASTTTQTPTTTTLAPVADEPAYGGFVRLGVVGEPRSLNPLGLDGGTDAVVALIHAVTTGAVRLDPETLDPIPLAIDALPTRENGGLEVTESGELIVRYTIRDDAEWADGTPVTFEDFAQTYAIARQASGVHPDVRDKYGAIVAGSLSGDGKAVEYRLRDPSLAWTTLFDVLVPAHQVTVSGFSSAWAESMWVAGGGFRFVELDAAANRVELAANERSWLEDPESGAPLPYLEGVTIRYYPTRAELVAAVEAGEVDAAAIGGDLATLERLAADPNLLLDVRRGPAWEQIGFQFGPGRDRTNPQSVVADVAVRRAIAALLDRDGIAAEIQGAFGRSLDSITGASWPAAEHAVWDVLDAPAPAAAETLREIVEAGETAPIVNFATTANDAEREVVARRLVDVLEPLGFVVEVSRTEPGAYFLDRIIPGDFEVAAWAWEAQPGPRGAVEDFRDHHLVSWPEGTDFYNWSDSASPQFEEFATGLRTALAEPDYAGLSDRLVELEQLVMDDVVLIPLYAELNGAVARVEVRGFQHSILPGGEASSITRWWLGS